VIRIRLNNILKIKHSPFQIRYILKMLVFMLVLFNLSCKNSSNTNKQISAIDVGLNIERFDKLFASSNPTDLPSLKSKYPFLFSNKFSDSIWIDRMKDPIVLSIACLMILKLQNLKLSYFTNTLNITINQSQPPE
jgi:hypothetical protein